MNDFIGKKWVAAMACTVLLSFGAGLSGVYLGLNILSKNQDERILVETKIVAEESAVIDVVEKSQNAVVSIIISKDVPIFEENHFNPFWGEFGFGIPYREQVGTEQQQVGAGSGFLVSSDGLIITNRHVVEDEEALYSVVLNNGDIIDATVIDRDKLYDLAVLKIEGNTFDYLSLGDSTELQVGQGVVAIGNALGEFSNTVSSGIVSGLGRTVTASSGYGGTLEILRDVIQTDASINPGNSGGPLLDHAGNVIGVNVAVAQDAENIGFAIPINPVQAILDSIKQYGEIMRPYIGVRYVSLTPAMQNANDLAYNYGALIIRGQGAEELAVIPGGPADKAGLVENDIILEVNGIKIDEDHPLQNEIQQYSIGEEVTLKVYSKGEEKEVTVLLKKQE